MTDLVDDFNDGIAGDLVSDRPGWSVAGENYDVRVSDENGVYGTDTPEGSGRGGAMFDTGSGDHYAQMTLTSMNPNNIGPAVRVIDDRNWLGLKLGGTGGSGLRTYKKIAGVLSLLALEQGVSGNDYRLEVTDVGGGDSELELFENGVSMPDGPQVVSNSDFPVTATHAGIMNDAHTGGSSGNYWDNFNGGALGGAADSLTYVVTGGLSLLGEVTSLFTAGYIPAGGLSVTGGAPVIRRQVIEPSGGVVFAGAVASLAASVFSVVGGIVHGGAADYADHESTRDWSVTGGISLSGVAAWVAKVFSLAKLKLPFLTHAGPVSGNVTSSADQNVVSE